MIANLTKSALSNFIGTEQYYRHIFRQMVYTDGVHYLVENGAAWLVDAVASYQPDKRVKGNPRLRDFQLWELSAGKADSSVVLTCREDSGTKPIITQNIEYSDFPREMLPFTLYVEPSEHGPVCLLPSEH